MEEKGEKERVYLDNVEVATSGSSKCQQPVNLAAPVPPVLHHA